FINTICSWSCLIYLWYLQSSPTRRSSDLGNLDGKTLGILTETDESEAAVNRRQGFCDVLQETGVRILWDVAGSFGLEEQRSLEEDRKSTRLNSSHVSNSYPVFCLNKKILV